MSDYKIRIITEADKAGLQGVSKELGKTTEETRKLDDAQKKAGESTKGFAKEHKGLLDGFKKLGQEVPILGAAINALKNPYTALAFAIGIVVVKLKEFMDAVDEAATQAQGLDRFNGIVRNFNTLAAEQRSKKNALAEQLNDIATKAKSAEDNLRDANSQIERTLRLEGNEDTANKANELSKVERDVERGVITEAQGVKAKAGIEAKYITRAQDRETRKAAGQVTAAGNARRLAAEQAAGFEAQLPGLISAEKAAQDKLDRAQRQEEQTVATGVMINGKMVPLADAYKLRNELKQQYDTGGGTMGYSGERGESLRAGMKDKIGGIESAIDQYQHTLDLQRASTRSAKSEFDIASGRTAKASSGLVAARESAATLGTTYSNLVTSANQELASGRRASATELNTIGINADNEANAILQKEAAKQAEEMTKKLQATLESLGKANNASSDIMKAAENLFNQAKAAAASGNQ